jgi:hypothetical protein
MQLAFIQDIFKKKPTIFIVIPLVYLLITALVRWFPQVTIDVLLYMLGGLVGIFFLDIAEGFFQLNPSPFRSIVFFCAFICVSFFIITSSGSALASGLVLSLFLTLLLWQWGEWRVAGNVGSWYRMVAVPVDQKIQRNMLIVTGVLFVLETLLFIR